MGGQEEKGREAGPGPVLYSSLPVLASTESGSNPAGPHASLVGSHVAANVPYSKSKFKSKFVLGCYLLLATLNCSALIDIQSSFLNNFFRIGQQPNYSGVAISFELIPILQYEKIKYVLTIKPAMT